MKAYSTDVTSELDRELTDVFPEARDLLYHFVDARSTLSPGELNGIFLSAGIHRDRIETVTEFLIYYGVLGVRSAGEDRYIYSSNYDLRPIRIRLSRDPSAVFVINPAFWPELNIVHAPSGVLDALAADGEAG
ncbi:MAG: hypothetical protein E5W74_32640 [Mesorhizobium sp.]|nr:MAG: hypothetical protein E5W74_32640 [Mesorhizobium sp.]